MKNPLRKRLLRELKSDFGKYLVIFLLLTAFIGVISGFLVADGSMLTAYNESFEKYNIEDGNFTISNKLNRARQKSISEMGVSLYENFYYEQSLDNGSTLRMFENRTEVNKVCLMEGELPTKDGEIAIDRMYADNNGLSVGDVIYEAVDENDSVSDGTDNSENLEASNGYEAGSDTADDSTTESGQPSDDLTESDAVSDTADSAESKTVKSWTITGLVALSDYSALFSDNTDSMFDSVKFGVAILPEGGLSEFDSDLLTYCYSWKYDDAPADEAAQKEAAEDFMETLGEEVSLTEFIPEYQNQAIHFTGDDMGNDRAMMVAMLYIVIVILAFVFGITISNTIMKEASVIGTLRASGYTRGELLRHYLAMSLIVTAAGAVVGNILGYTYFKNFCASLYYGSYSLPTYKTIWNGEAFFQTTVIPVILMAVVNLVVLRRKLSLSPLQFLRRDLRRKRQRGALPLNPHLPFFARFQLRVILQNLSSYAVLFVGILFANLLLMFGLIMPLLLDHYQEEMENNLLCNYQYMLQMPVDMATGDSKLETYIEMLIFASEVQTENEDAEEFSAYELHIVSAQDGSDGESVTLYGVDADSRYISLGDAVKSDSQEDGSSDADGLSVTAGDEDLQAESEIVSAGEEKWQVGSEIVSEESEDENEDGSKIIYGGDVLVSSAYSEKYDLKPGDEITLKESYEDTKYLFSVSGIYDYQGALAIFMERGQLNATFDLDEDYYCGYLSDTEITDIDEEYIGTVIDLEALTKVSRQLDVSMGSMMYLLDAFAIIMFMILIYLLSKMIIEKNAHSISMVKILGYSNGEISRLYILSTSAVVVVLLLVSLPIETVLMQVLWKIVMMNMTGWISFFANTSLYVRMFLLGVGTYAVVALLEYKKIQRVPMDEALKIVE